MPPLQVGVTTSHPTKMHAPDGLILAIDPGMFNSLRKLVMPRDGVPKNRQPCDPHEASRITT